MADLSAQGSELNHDDHLLADELTYLNEEKEVVIPDYDSDGNIIDISDDEDGVVRRNPNRIDQDYDCRSAMAALARPPFHQNPAVFDTPNTSLWRVPDLNNLHGGLAKKRFTHALQTVREVSKREPQDVIPAMLRDSTPYSMALILILRDLAEALRVRNGGWELAERFLVQLWKARVLKFGIHEPTNDRVFIMTNPRQLPRWDCDGSHFGAEEVVQENVNGIILGDVAAATHSISPPGGFPRGAETSPTPASCS